MPWISFFLYRNFLAPLTVLILRSFAFLFPAKIQEMVRDRENPNWTPLLTEPIWIHASSGEIEYAKPVIRELKKNYPELPILVTYFSPSAKKLIRPDLGADLIMPLPWDDTASIQKFFDFYRPRLALFSRTDTWPGFATEAKWRKIPQLLFSATFGENSSRLKGPGAGISKWALGQMDEIFCVATEDAKLIQTHLPNLKLTVAGDTRYDQALFRLQGARRVLPAHAPSSKIPIFVAGSTWPEDEAMLLPILRQVLDSGVATILAPHETDEAHLQSLENQLTHLGLPFIRFSVRQDQQWDSKKILLIDRVGILAEIYAEVTLAFVGGSFKDRVHSVMEPLAAGLPVLVGPQHLNNREALQFQGVLLSNKRSVVRSVASSAEILQQIQFWKSEALNSGETPLFKSEIQALIQQRAGCSKRVVRWIESQLNLPR